MSETLPPLCATSSKLREIHPIDWVILDFRKVDLSVLRGGFMPNGSFIVTFESEDCRGQIEFTDSQLAVLAAALRAGEQSFNGHYYYDDEEPQSFQEQFPCFVAAMQDDKEQT